MALRLVFCFGQGLAGFDLLCRLLIYLFLLSVSQLLQPCGFCVFDCAAGLGRVLIIECII